MHPLHCDWNQNMYTLEKGFRPKILNPKASIEEAKTLNTPETQVTPLQKINQGPLYPRNPKSSANPKTMYIKPCRAL